MAGGTVKKKLAWVRHHLHNSSTEPNAQRSPLLTARDNSRPATPGGFFEGEDGVQSAQEPESAREVKREPSAHDTRELARVEAQAGTGPSADGVAIEAPDEAAADDGPQSPRLLHRQATTLSKVDEDDVLPPSITGQTAVETEDGLIYGTEFEMGEDAYAATLVAIIRNFTVISMKLHQGIPVRMSNVSRLFFSVLAMMLNLGLQGSILVYIQRYIVRRNIRTVQIMYRRFRAHYVLPNGRLDQTAWNDEDIASDEFKHALCGITMWKQHFYYCILFLWALTNLSEFRNIQRLLMRIFQLPTCSHGKDMLSMDEQSFHTGGSCLVMALTKPVRYAVLIIVCLPRLVIAICLLCLGWEWLSATSSFESMVLNSLALSFVINIDELLYTSILPLTARHMIHETRFFVQEKQMTIRSSEVHESRGYANTGVWLLIVVIGMIVYREVLQDVLPADLSDLQEACESKSIQADFDPHCYLRAWMQVGSKLNECYPIKDD